MKSNNKSRKINYIIILVFIITLISCQNQTKRDMSNINTEILRDIKNSEYGAVGPKFIYATDKYSVILDSLGLIIYNNESEKISSVIDVAEKGYNHLQGSIITEAMGNEDKLILKNLLEDEYLEIELKSGDNIIKKDLDTEFFREVEYYNYDSRGLDLDLIEKYTLEEIQAIELEDEIIFFTNDYKLKDKDWRIIVLNKNNGKVKLNLNIFN